MITFSLPIGSSAARCRGLSVDGRRGSITLSASLDYDSGLRSLTCLATATDALGLSTTMNITFNVFNDDDENPQFVGGPYTATVMEDAAIGTRVAAPIEAYDPDSDGTLPTSLSFAFVLPDTLSPLFALDSATGVVTTAGVLDAETAPQHGVTVRVSDARGKTKDTLLLITVGNVEDNAPAFTETLQSFTVMENAGGVTIGRFVAVDKDNSRLTYAITAGNTAEEFELLPDGVLLTREGLDREAQDVHLLTITASDGVHVGSTHAQITGSSSHGYTALKYVLYGHNVVEITLLFKLCDVELVVDVRASSVVWTASWYSGHCDRVGVFYPSRTAHLHPRLPPLHLQSSM